MFNVKFADIGEGIHEGTIFSVDVKPGDKIDEGETLFSVETDKVTAEIPSPVSGEIKAVNYKESDQIQVGQIIVVIDDGKPDIRSNMEGGEIAENHEPASQTVASHSSSSESTLTSVEEQGSTSVVGEIEVSSELIPSSSEASSSPKETVANQKILSTPVARKLAKDLGVNIQSVIGTGPAGRVMKADIYEAHDKTKDASDDSSVNLFAKEVTAPPVYNQEKVSRQPMTMIRKTIAENMVISKFTIPHTAVMDEVDVTDLVAFRQESKDIAQAEGIKLTYLAFIIKAITIALKKHPIVNASVDMEAGELIMKHYVNMGLAVDTSQGLMVPVIKDADLKSIFEIASAIADLSKRATEKTLHLDELKGSSFTVTNYGAFGSSFGVPVINYPDAAVLGVGAIAKKPVVVEDEILIRHMLPLSMSFDHRVMDGADAGRFMQTLKKLLSTPHLLLMN